MSRTRDDDEDDRDRRDDEDDEVEYSAGAGFGVFKWFAMIPACGLAVLAGVNKTLDLAGTLAMLSCFAALLALFLQAEQRRAERRQ